MTMTITMSHGDTVRNACRNIWPVWCQWQYFEGFA